MQEVRETLTHLTSLNRFEDVQVFQEPAGAGVRLRYVLFPLHPVDRMDFRGTLGLSQDEVRRVFTERFGAAPSAGRAEEVTAALLAFYRDRGYAGAEVVPRIEETHNPDRATMIFEIRAGSRASIGRVDVDEIDGSGQAVAGGVPIRVGDPFDNDEILRELNRYVAQLHERGFYEARAVHSFTVEPDVTATVRVNIDRGPMVSIAFAGDPLPEADRERLVPVRAEGSADEDLLEDANAAIEEYLQGRGYRDAVVEYARTEGEAAVTITYKIARGPRYVVDAVAITGNTAVPTMDLVELLQVEVGEPYVQAAAGTGAAAIRNAYRARGFTRVDVRTDRHRTSPRGRRGTGNRSTCGRPVHGHGRTADAGRVCRFAGNTVLAEPQLRALMTTAPGRPYSEGEIAVDRDRIDLEYRNRGYESVVVNPVHRARGQRHARRRALRDHRRSAGARRSRDHHRQPADRAPRRSSARCC